jgi:hypothetical protein
MIRYTCIGSVRGCCGVAHRTLEGAAAHCERDQRACASLGGGAYSDRRVQRLDGAPLTDDEELALQDRSDSQY